MTSDIASTLPNFFPISAEEPMILHLSERAEISRQSLRVGTNLPLKTGVR